jgi:uncharacterized protein (TIGR00369 family)
MKKTEELRPLPVRYNHDCFGCGAKNEHGLQMRFFTNGSALFSRITIPKHLSGWQNYAHGGVITTALDEIMGWSAIHLLKTFVLTKSISIDFLKPVFVGTEMKAEARLVEKRSDREAVMEASLFDPEGNLCSKSVGVFALLSPEAALKFGLMDAATRDEMLQMIGG